MMENKNEKIIASFELAVMVVSIFAFAHLVYLSNGNFKEMKIDELSENIPTKVSGMGVTLGILFDKLKTPLIPFVSADYFDDYIYENETRTTYSISSDAEGAGCCFITEEGYKCATSTPENCVADSPFAEGALCIKTSFCRKGCCFDEELGIYDSNVLEVDCSASWVADPNCNMPAAQLGCCVLGTTTIFETQGQCEVDTLTRALGDSSAIDWRAGMGEGECFLLSVMQNEGACVLGSGVCEFTTEGDCYNYGGDFSGGYLCTSSLLDTSCEMTKQTTCVEGKDGVYFVDSCGNPANIYDSTKVNDPNYWEKIIEPESVCGSRDVSGSADSAGCGNCNRFLGSVCSSATESNFDVNVGDFYCKDLSCMLDGVRYKNGESWCVYDGKIGDGDDVVGSRHWKYVCSQGTVQIEPCADYRNQICVQSNTFDVEGNEVEFRNSACVANNWRACINANSEGGDCEDILNCRIEEVSVADMFSFSMCVPKYPGGFDLRDERYQKTASETCGMASMDCTVVYAPKTWGGCELVANEGCLGSRFAEEMNDFCRSLGDCGGEVNILGEYTANHQVSGETPGLSGGYIEMLKAMAEPVPGQFAEVEDYTEFLMAAGLYSSTDPESAEGDGESKTRTNAAIGGTGVMMTAVVLQNMGTFMSASAITSSGTGTISGGTAWLSAFSGVAIGATIGAVAGIMLAKQLGLNPGGTMVMAAGGALVGGAVGFGIWAAYGTNIGWLMAMGPWGWAVAIIGLILMAVAGFFMGGSSCKPKTVSFTCNSWQPPRSGDDCEKCNDDPLKPCSEYRCHSLGAACELVNKGTRQEMCVDGSPNDVSPPVIKPQVETSLPGIKYDDISENGFSITSDSGGCIDAYTLLVFGITTDELTQCKFDVMESEFDNMAFSLGESYYGYNHTIAFSLPDPSHGQSQGGNWTGDLTLYVKCVDTHGHESPGFYTIDVCVNEGPDRTAPRVIATEPVNEKLVSFDSSSENVEFITNELSICKWDSVDTDYYNMLNEMTCEDRLEAPSSLFGYVCSTELSTMDAESTYYVRCADQPWLNDSSERNVNAESFVYTLRKPESKIAIDWIEPSQDFESSTEMTTIELQIMTSGGSEWHGCSYSFSGYDKMIELFETGLERPHVQPLNRPAGTHKIYVECRDETGDSARGYTEFEIIHDTSVPQIARVWQSDGKLYIITTEDAECRYSTETCKFIWSEGELAGSGDEHVISVDRGKTYYIKCEDDFGNAPSDCSIKTMVL